MVQYQWALFVLCGYGWLCDQVGSPILLEKVIMTEDVLSFGKQLSPTHLHKLQLNSLLSIQPSCR